MGNHKFRLFDMCWFSKLKHFVRADGSQPLQSSTKKNQNSTSSHLPPIQAQKQQQQFLQNRASHYVPSKERKEKPPRSPINAKASDTRFPVDLPPRKSKRRPRKLATKPCASAATLSRKSVNMSEDKDPCKHSSEKIEKMEFEELEELEMVSELKLPPILTKPTKEKDSFLQQTGVPAARRSAMETRRVKVQRNSPRTESKKLHALKAARQRKETKTKTKKKRVVSESLVMIKSSSNPWRDFADSMLEMIVENNIREPDELEELLACYLSLNSEEYHEVIVKVFEHIWFAVTDVRNVN
ncbi:transcription repressor OFP1-like [Canna indica]|uniref:Transcription repressor n=1 Tax=Canna indica TaxID=4628 RepID=A0AAQ3Q2C1_9LILI|nr:transcription repressor OFP1-like [Canna indica]